MFKPQPPGEYIVTVLLQGNKKPVEPLTFNYFTMRHPEINEDVIPTRDGKAATIEGWFFGDKKGDVIFGYLGGETVEESAKVVDWSMNSISFKPPEGLSGRYVMIIRNEVGATSRVVNLVLGGPLGYSPPLPDSYGNEFGFNTASGVYYKGKFYVFSVDPSDEIRINREFVRVRTFNPSSGHL